ncbi:hypothetical protein DFP97_102184 [Paenibacillus prosopidis]|uniref:Uncharacterized protein n=1 Tax=Paenibacillus prosopidis TaxID=630520 RepID=A0A368W6M7_9BACL|nr:hypothetical protein DFP97_102184 [Paenibacillus prosopidis]
MSAPACWYKTITNAVCSSFGNGKSLLIENLELIIDFSSRGSIWLGFPGLSIHSNSGTKDNGNKWRYKLYFYYH